MVKFAKQRRILCSRPRTDSMNYWNCISDFPSPGFMESDWRQNWNLLFVLWKHTMWGVQSFRVAEPLPPMVGRLLQNSTMYICIQQSISDSTSTQDIFSQRLYSFNFNTRYFHSTTILIQLQHGLFLWKTNIYSTSTPKVIFYETNIFIQLQQKNIFVQQNIFIKFFKFLDIDEFLFNKAPPPYTPAAPSLKTWKQHI